MRPFGARAHRRARARRKRLSEEEVRAARSRPTDQGRAAFFPVAPNLSRRGQPACAYGAFSEGGKTAYCNAALMQFALSAVMFGLRRDEGRPLPALTRGFDHASGGSNKGLGEEEKGFDD
jgi:hypothetical protein